MSESDSVSYNIGLQEYQKQAQALYEAVNSGNQAAWWRFKWMHPKFKGKPVAEVQTATLHLADAQVVVARDYGFESWQDLVQFIAAVSSEGSVARFEAAVEAVITGNSAVLRSMLAENPELVRARSTRRHHASLLHYVAANGIENSRQKIPRNAVEIAKILLDAGAEVDALADMYDAQCTTMSMLVCSCVPHEAGLQAVLAETLLDYGAAVVGPGSNWQSALMTALAFG